MRAATREANPLLYNIYIGIVTNGERPTREEWVAEKD